MNVTEICDSTWFCHIGACVTVLGPRRLLQVFVRLDSGIWIAVRCSQSSSLRKTTSTLSFSSKNEPLHAFSCSASCFTHRTRGSEDVLGSRMVGHSGG